MGATLRCGARASLCWGARALGGQASVVMALGLSSCGSRALECRLSSCGAQALLRRSMWDLPGPGIEPVSPTLAGGFLTTASPGKSDNSPVLIIPNSKLELNNFYISPAGKKANQYKY